MVGYRVVVYVWDETINGPAGVMNRLWAVRCVFCNGETLFLTYFVDKDKIISGIGDFDA